VAAHVHTPLTPPDQVLLGITQLTSDALVRAMAKQPPDRFETYEDLQMALEAARSELLVRQFREGGQDPPNKSWWRKNK